MHPSRNTRGHFLSLLYLCAVPDGFVPPNGARAPEQSGYLQWHDACPANLIRVHEVYRPYICAERALDAIPVTRTNPKEGGPYAR
jgi:colanic acid biosynthesis protein WcaH